MANLIKTEISHSGVAKRTTANKTLSLLLAGAMSLGMAIAPVSGPAFAEERIEGSEHFNYGDGSRRIYRDDIGRYFIRHGYRVYIQYWDDVPTYGDIDPHPGYLDQDYPQPIYPHPGYHPGDTPDDGHAKNKKLKDAAIIAGIAGLAVGALIAGSKAQAQQPVIAQQPLHPLPRPQLSTAFPPAPSGQPHVITYQNAFEPWSQGWRDWCDARYRSFDQRTGTYRGYDGQNHFCVVK
jgi:hypothetical protein